MSLLVGTTLRGACGTLARSRAVAGDLVAIAVVGGESIDELVAGRESGGTELILVLGLGALGTRMRGASIHAGG
jgi:hypothetical protein